MSKVKINKHIIPFTLGELWLSGDGMKCAIKDREERTSTLYLTKEERKRLPANCGPDAASYICQHNLGLPICSNCAPEYKGERPDC